MQCFNIYFEMFPNQNNFWKLKQTFFIKYFWKQIKEQGILFFIMEIRERDNNLLYGVSPWRLLSGYLLQNKDVDLCVESYIYKGYSETVLTIEEGKKE